MRKKIFNLIILNLFILIVLSSYSLAWTNLTGGDHGGADWTPAANTYISGNHYNIGTFTVTSGEYVYIQPYDGSNYGYVIINATNIQIDGNLNANGAGYGGGGGGGSGTGSVFNYPSNAAGTAGSAGSGTAGGSNGNAGSASTTTTGAAGGTGGSGGGSYGGSAGSAGSAGPLAEYSSNNGGSGGTGGIGGYATSAGQGDSSTDESLLMGSGGAGGGGGGGGGSDASAPGTRGGSGGSGGAGGRGGGYIKLYASEKINVTYRIRAYGLSSSGDGNNGVAGGFGGAGASGVTGGNAASSGSSTYGTGGAGGTYLTNVGGTGGNGGAGGGGAGGGILLKAPQVYLDSAATIINLGRVSGSYSATNGGTVKIFYDDNYGTPSTSGITSGRTYTATYSSCAIPTSGTFTVPYDCTYDSETINRPNTIINFASGAKIRLVDTTLIVGGLVLNQQGDLIFINSGSKLYVR